jgi:hypothetical protein
MQPIIQAVLPDSKSIHIQSISRAIIMSPAELKMQPTMYFQSERGYFKFRIVLKRNYGSMMALLLIILFVTTDIYDD